MSKKVTTEQFIEAAKKIHGDSYDYSKVIYRKAIEHVCIICPVHGEFWQAPDKHLHGRGCPRCARPNSGLSQEEFIQKLHQVHGDKYDFTKSIYTGYNDKVIATCPEHGDFSMRASQLLQGHGCQRCGGSGRYSTTEFIEKHRRIFGDKYDYSKTDLDNRQDNKICIICPEHGEYYKTPTAHLKSGCPKCNQPNHGMDTARFIEAAKKVHGDKFDYSKSEYKGIYTKVIVTCPTHGDILVSPNNFIRGFGCKKCAAEAQAAMLKARAANEFEEKARLIHGDKYDYSKVEYKTAHDKVCIICPEHGEFWQDPNHHLMGNQCPQCAHRSWAYTTDEFIAKAREVHGNKYGYDEVQYVNNHTLVKVVCKEHGIFEISPSYLLVGGNCPECTALKIESKQESDIRALLDRHGIRFVREKQFPWLRRGRVMPLDFYLPDFNIGIECQGIQHFKSHPWFGGTDGLEDIRDRDSKKKELCDKHGLTLLYYSDLKIKYPYDVIQNTEDLLVAIKSGGKRLSQQLQLEFDFEQE